MKSINKKFISLSLAVLIIFSSFVIAFAETTTGRVITNDGSSDGDVIATAAATSEAETTAVQTTEAVTISPEILQSIADEQMATATTTEDNSEIAEEAETEDVEPVDSGSIITDEEPSSIPATDSARENSEENTSGKDAYTTIYLTGITLPTTMKIKHIETGEKFTLSFTEDRNFAASFYGPEGEYKILSLSTGMVSIKNGKVYNSDGEKIKTFTIKRVNGWQEIKLESSERATFNILLFMKQHWFLFTALIVLLIALYVLKKKRVLPSQPI